MSSTLILKPQGETHYEGSPNTICCAMLLGGASAVASRMPGIEAYVWTYPRDNLPPPFVGSGMSLNLWQCTWDLVYERIDSEIKLMKEMAELQGGSWPFLPCFVPCIIIQAMCINGSRISELGHQNEMEWLKLVKDCSKLLEGNRNISVTLAKEPRMSGTREHRTMTNVSVGLQFDIIQNTPRNLKDGGASENKQEGLTDELEKLHEMYKKGVLSESEYKAAKGKILGI